MKQSIILIKSFAFTWRSTFNKIRVMYFFVIRSIMIYVSTTWHTLKTKKSSIDNKLTMFRNKCLRIVTKIFRITFVFVLKIKTHIIFMRIHFDQLQTQTCLWLRIKFAAKFITDSCKIMFVELRSRIDRKRKHKSHQRS